MSLQTRLAALITAIGADINSIQTSLATKAADSLVMHLAGTETVTGTKTFSAAALTLGDGTNAPIFLANGAAGQYRGYAIHTAASARWFMLASTAAESGGNAGSNLQFIAYADDGVTPLGIFLSIARATGLVSVSSLKVSSTLTVNEIAAPATPAAGTGVFWADSTDSRPYFKGDNGQVSSMTNVEAFTFTQTGAAVVDSNRKSQIVLQAAYAVESIHAYSKTAPTGASLIVDVNKNGTTLFTTQGNRPTIAASGNSSTNTLPDVTTFAAGDILSVDIDQVGSTVAGGDNLTVCIRLRRV